jgi:hypothetical protein
MNLSLPAPELVAPKLDRGSESQHDWLCHGNAERGRQVQLARHLDVEPRVSRHLVNDWIFESGIDPIGQRP